MKKICFVIGPIGEEGSKERKHADEVIDRIIKPAVAEFGYDVIRADQYQVPGQITYQIVYLIATSDLVIADLSFFNPNVLYELALRHITRKPFIHLIREEDKDKIPFDIKDIRYIGFNLRSEESVNRAKNELKEQIENAEKQIKETKRWESVQYISTLLGRMEIIFPSLKYFANEGISEDNSKRKFRKIVYKNRMITNLDFSDSFGDELKIENVNVIRVDISDTKIGTFHIKDSIINLLDISGCSIKKLFVEGTKIVILDASDSEITIFVKRGVEFAYPDFSGAEVLEEKGE